MDKDWIEEIAEKVTLQLHKDNNPRMSLAIANELVQCLRQKAGELGIAAVFSVCNAYGNMVCTEAMDDSYIVSFDAAMRKAYTAVAVQMPTLELGRLSLPGGTYYGVDGADGGKLMLIGGGIPLIYHDTLYGGLGVSGSTGEIDHDLAFIGTCYFNHIMNNR